MKLLKLPVTIATLDIECLALEPLNPVVDEIGIIFTNILPSESPFSNNIKRHILDNIFAVKEQGVVYEEELITPFMLEQIIELGNVVEAKTVEFRKFAINKNGHHILPFYERNETFCLEDTFYSLVLEFEKFAPKELWVNHPEFDLPRVQNVFPKSLWKSPWNYKSIGDISLLKRLMRNQPNFSELNLKEIENHPSLEEMAKHEALADCRWNLWILSVAQQAELSTLDLTKVKEIDI